MYKYLIQGLFLGLAYVAPIGMQNLYVINTAMKGNKTKSYQVAFATIFFDITLALACYFGIGLLIRKIPFLKPIILIIGSILVIYIGITLISTSADMTDIKTNDSLLKIITTCFVVTWMNPQALIDGSLLLGSYNASIPTHLSKYFIFGFCSASFIWFTFLSSLTLILSDNLNNRIIKRINIICGVILIFFGAKLGYTFIQFLLGS